jgi:hypothetical protein
MVFMKQKIQGGRWLLGPVCALGLMLIVGSGHRTLLQRSKRIATFDAVYATHCVWISDHTAIYMRYRKDDSGFELARIDADTGRVTALDTLNRKYEALMRWRERPGLSSFTSEGRMARMVPALSASPDGKWLVFCTWPDNMADLKGRCRYIAMNLEGTQEAQWKSSTRLPREPLWLHDGHRWLELVYEEVKGRGLTALTSLIVHDLNRPGEDKTLTARGALLGIWVAGIAEQDRLWGGPMSLPGTMQETLRPITRVTYAIYDVPGLSSGNNSAGVSLCRVDLPEGTWNYERTLSLYGDRLVWDLWVHHSSWADRLTHRFLPSTPLRFEERRELWVSGLDGSHMTEIGYHPLSYRTGQDNLYQIQWLPGGKKISFLYRDGIYTASAP